MRAARGAGSPAVRPARGRHPARLRLRFGRAVAPCCPERPSTPAPLHPPPLAPAECHVIRDNASSSRGAGSPAPRPAGGVIPPGCAPRSERAMAPWCPKPPSVPAAPHAFPRAKCHVIRDNVSNSRGSLCCCGGVCIGDLSVSVALRDDGRDGGVAVGDARSAVGGARAGNCHVLRDILPSLRIGGEWRCGGWALKARGSKKKGRRLEPTALRF
jgi:hypothetical protein